MSSEHNAGGKMTGTGGAVEARGVAINVRDVSKCYHVYEKPEDRLKQAIFPRLRRVAGMAPRNFNKEFWALRDVVFQVRKGETIGIIGKNGSGKSTLLQAICGTLTPTSGTIDVDGRVAALLELGAGFNPEFSGRENVYMSGALLGLSKQQIDERFDRIAEFADIGEFIEQPVKTYSSGMYVRLAFAVIAHVDADILVIDEALSVGDVFFGQKCMRFLRDFMKRGTVIFVSHDTAAVLNLCERVVWLSEGRIAGDGPAKEVTERYLENLYYEDRGAQGTGLNALAAPDPGSTKLPERDMRQDLINSSELRNDIEVFDFRENSRAFGVGGARVLDAGFFDEDGRPLSWVVGGEMVTLAIRCQALAEITAPIVGFEVYDRLGQTIFGDNTYLSTRVASVAASNGDILRAEFSFRMPVMREGDYTLSVAIAEGTQENHIQHHWLHEALAFHVHVKSICIGLVGVPMADIRMRVEQNASDPTQ